jgi:hypothetical protein
LVLIHDQIIKKKSLELLKKNVEKHKEQILIFTNPITARNRAVLKKKSSRFYHLNKKCSRTFLERTGRTKNDSLINTIAGEVSQSHATIDHGRGFCFFPSLL